MDKLLVAVDEIPFHSPGLSTELLHMSLTLWMNKRDTVMKEIEHRFCHSHTKTDFCPVTIPYPSITIPANAPQKPHSRSEIKRSVSTSLWLTHLESQQCKTTDCVLPSCHSFHSLVSVWKKQKNRPAIWRVAVGYTEVNNFALKEAALWWGHQAKLDLRGYQWLYVGMVTGPPPPDCKGSFEGFAMTCSAEFHSPSFSFWITKENLADFFFFCKF